MTEGPAGPEYVPTPEERRQNREKARGKPPGPGGPPGRPSWWSRRSTKEKIGMIVGPIIFIVVLVSVLSGGKKNDASGGDKSAAQTTAQGEARVVILGRRSKCWEVPSSARVFAQVYVTNRGNAPGKVDAWLAVRYSDSGNAVEEAPDTFTIQPGTVRVAYIAHDYNALQHDVIECSASLDDFDHETSIKVLAPE